MGQPAYTRTALVQLLRDNGPMGSAELTVAIELSRKSVDSCIVWARKKFGGEFFYIHHYEFTRGRGGREIPIYAAGPGVDVRKPAMGQAAVDGRQRRYREKNRQLIRARDNLRRGRTEANPYQQLMNG